MSGWFKIFRSITEWEWYTSPNCVAVFVDILARANYEDGKYLGATIPKGSLTTSAEAIGHRTGLSRQQVRTVLDKLKSTNEITIKTNKHYSMITVTNWERYQEDQPTRQPSSNHLGNHPVTTSKNLRNKEVKNISDACLVVDYFNAKLGTKLQQVESNYKHINARLKEGFTTDQMKTLIDHVSLEWVSDPFWCKYVQLSTMFGGKFDSYLQKIDSKPTRTPEMIEAEFRMFL